ncbi:hypothetical protein [Xanthocytophaga agilis]|uniref:Uncharacterized protein n=1 Tax=Xanthocytophaga agilis TaxID=3048010 RepID=A0AAE3R5L9_9BACT|nr:hypothetical protein [Xanthocytophaga agilis]MDJ1501834.1 hypothetical protein [Xanthocytophaga agilis]
MIDEKMIKNILFSGLIVALFIYHGLTILQEYAFHIKSNSWESLMTITRILVTTVLLFLTLKWRWLVSIFLGDAFVVGSYEGISTQKQNPNNVDHHEDFVISQSILWTRISGRSKLKNGPLVSNWKGKLIDYDGDKEFRFAIELQTSNGNKWGILTLRIDKGIISGFYFPTDTTQPNYISTIGALAKSLNTNKK